MRPLVTELRKRIIDYYLENFSIRKIAEVLRVSKSAVGRVISLYKEENSISPKLKGNCGRKSLLDNREMRRLGRASQANPTLSARQLQIQLKGKFSSMHLRSVQRYLRKIGRYAYRPKKSPSWTKRQRICRYEWCRDRKDLSPIDWQKYPE